MFWTFCIVSILLLIGTPLIMSKCALCFPTLLETQPLTASHFVVGLYSQRCVCCLLCSALVNIGQLWWQLIDLKEINASYEKIFVLSKAWMRLLERQHYTCCLLVLVLAPAIRLIDWRLSAFSLFACCIPCSRFRALVLKSVLLYLAHKLV